jgi:hypothetical protein
MLSVLTPNCFWITGIATFTMLVSKIDMNMPMIRTSSGRPHPFGGRCTSGSGLSAGGRCGGGPDGLDPFAAVGADWSAIATEVLPSAPSPRSSSTTPDALAPPVLDVDIDCPSMQVLEPSGTDRRRKTGTWPRFTSAV